MALVVGVAALGLAGCVDGNTDEASGVSADSAQLNAHGHTAAAGPDYYWWEYATDASALGTASDVEVCGSEADNRCGPASSSTDQHLETTVSGLKPDTTYYFRFCTQDVAQGSPRVCFRTLSFKTLHQYVLDRKWGSQGSGDGQFNVPRGVATDASGNVYVADTGNARIEKFDSSGNFLAKWGNQGSGDGQFSAPGGVATDGSGNAYVADAGNNRIQKFSSSGSFLAKWGSQGSGDGQFSQVGHVAADGSGNVYVADAGNHRIQKFDSSGNFLAKWGSYGSGDGQFSWPSRVATDGAGNVYVAESRIQKFDSSGSFIAKWDDSTCCEDVAADSSGAVYATGFSVGGNAIVEKFSSSASLLARWVTKEGPIQLDCGDGLACSFQPDPTEYLAADRSGNVYVADVGNNQIEKYRPAQ